MTLWLRAFNGRILTALALCGAFAGCQTAPVAKGAAAQPIFYPQPPDPPRVQFLTAVNVSRDIVEERAGLARVVLGSRDRITRTDLLERPYGVAAWDGKIYVCDMGAGAVKVFDTRSGRFYLLGGNAQIMTAPANLCIDPQGYKFVVESMPRHIQVFDPQDRFVTTFNIKDGRPSAVAAVGEELFVTDIDGDRVLVLDRKTGNLLRTFGGKGHEPGQFLMPNAIARDADGNLYVSDQMNNRFQKVDRQGKPLLVAGKAGDAYGSFARPRGIAVGPDGIVYAVDAIYEVVQMFDQQGRVLMGFGNYHAAPGYLELPAGVAADKSCLPYFEKYVDPRFAPDYLLFVASQVGNTRVGVYAFGHLKPGAEIPVPPIAPATAAP